MLAPIFATASQIDTFKQGKEDYVMMTFFFNSPEKTEGNWRPPVGMLPVSTIIMPRSAYKSIVTKFLGYMARQEEGAVINETEEDKDETTETTTR